MALSYLNTVLFLKTRHFKKFGITEYKTQKLLVITNLNCKTNLSCNKSFSNIFDKEKVIFFYDCKA